MDAMGRGFYAQYIWMEGINSGLSRRMLLSFFAAPLLPAVSLDLAQRPLLQPYFPSVTHQFVWRNWDLVPTSGIARALHTDQATIERIGQQMALDARSGCTAVDQRLEFNVLRRNWFFVPREQIGLLLDLHDSELEKILDRDAFYRSHFGPQPKFENIRLSRDSSKSSVIECFKYLDPQVSVETPFAFEKELAEPPRKRQALAAERPLIIAYPYFCPFGDVLADPNCMSYYPKGLLERMAQSGVSAIWLHALLRDLVEDPRFQQDYPFNPERGKCLNQIIARCGEVGLGVYLYLNEPRGAHDSFYRRHPEMKGAPGRKDDGLWCMCTSSYQTRRFLRESSKRLFEQHTELAGVILITASENPTNCYSLTRHPECERCSRRPGSSVIGEVVREIASGAKAGKASAHIIAWDWSWGIVEDDPQAAIIRALPNEASLLVDFERGSRIVRDGTSSQVDEYSLSVTGPSQRARQHLELARDRGLETLGKAQIGTTWELGTLPFLAVPDLVAEKIKAFQQEGIKGGMFSWTLGAYPSLNWEVLAQLIQQPQPSAHEAIAYVARQRYGTAASGEVQRCWSTLAEIFRGYPFSNSLVYSSFVQEGPATPLFSQPSRLSPKILNSFDTLEWTAPFGPSRTAAVFRQMSRGWSRAVERLRIAEARMNETQRLRAQRDLRIIEAAGLYFDSIAAIIRYYEMRNNHFPNREELRGNVEQQLKTAERFLTLCQGDSRIGFEASLGYMYLPLDVREKIVACRYLLNGLPRPGKGEKNVESGKHSHG